MSKRVPADGHARDRFRERYEIALDDRARKEVLDLIRGCHWVPLELQGTRIRALLKYQEQFINLVFETADLALVTALPLNEERLTGAQFERARLTFPELACCEGSSREAVATPPPVREDPPSALKRKAVEPSFFDAVVLVRFGLDKEKAAAWWSTPNHEFGSRSPAELAASGKVEKVRNFLERSRREKRFPRIPQHRDSARFDCKTCHGYPPPEETCRCEEGRS